MPIAAAPVAATVARRLRSLVSAVLLATTSVAALVAAASRPQDWHALSQSSLECSPSCGVGKDFTMDTVFHRLLSPPFVFVGWLFWSRRPKQNGPNDGRRGRCEARRGQFAPRIDC